MKERDLYDSNKRDTYNKGKISLEYIPPINESNIIVIFTDTPQLSEDKILKNNQDKILFKKFTGSIHRIIDIKTEKLETLDRKYKDII